MAEALIDLCDGHHTKQAKTTFTKIKKPQNCPPRIMKDAVAEINSYPRAAFQGRGQQPGFYTIPGKHGFYGIWRAAHSIPPRSDAGGALLQER